MKINVNNENYFLELVAGGILTVTYEGKVFNNKTGNWIGKFPNQYGYHSIGYRVVGKVIHQLVHRLVFLVHGGILTDEFPIVNHKDGNKSNNHFENLEASNYSHNNQHAYDTGLNFLSEKTKENLSAMFAGELGYSAKLKDSQAEEIFFYYKNNKTSYRKMAVKYDVSHDTIGSIIRGETFSHLKLLERG